VVYLFDGNTKKTSIKNLKSEFVDWFYPTFCPKSYRFLFKYGGSELNNIENKYFQSFNDRLFEVDLDNIPEKIILIKGNLINKYNVDDKTFAYYSYDLSHGIPNAIINKHYIEFLVEYNKIINKKR
jgi:hypothetical protein